MTVIELQFANGVVVVGSTRESLERHIMIYNDDVIIRVGFDVGLVSEPCVDEVLSLINSRRRQ